MSHLIPAETIQKKILLIRGEKVLLDRHLADLYGVPTSQLNQAVKRNVQRFPADFMFQLTEEENDSLISQFVISKGRGGHRKLPYVFTEQGVAMLSSVLKSERAIEVNIAIMRAFVKLRELLSSHKDLTKKLEELERKYESHDKHIKFVFEAISQLMAEPKRRDLRSDFEQNFSPFFLIFMAINVLLNTLCRSNNIAFGSSPKEPFGPSSPALLRRCSR